MLTKIESVVFAVLVGCLGIAPAAHAQGKCSLKTFAGTYVSFERGSSLTIDLESQGVFLPIPNAPKNPLAWEARGIVPFVNIAQVTYTPDGVGNGYFWMFAGTAGATLDPVPLQIIVTELNEDCTGKFQYTLPNEVTIVERFIVFDNGRQYRSIPSSGGIPTLAWIGNGQRIAKPSELVHSCGPQTAHGTYLMTCENILRSAYYPTKAVADTLMLRMDVSMGGDYSGLLYERYGKEFIDARPSWGTINVSPDCSFTATLSIEKAGTLQERGLFFNEGKEFYGMGINLDGIKYSFCQGTRIDK
jgi:hypothetical protein